MLRRIKMAINKSSDLEPIKVGPSWILVLSREMPEASYSKLNPKSDCTLPTMEMEGTTSSSSTIKKIKIVERELVSEAMNTRRTSNYGLIRILTRALYSMDMTKPTDLDLW